MQALSFINNMTSLTVNWKPEAPHRYILINKLGTNLSKLLSALSTQAEVVNSYILVSVLDYC